MSSAKQNIVNKTGASICVRPFVEEDIPQVAELHRKVLGTGNRLTPDLLNEYLTYFHTVFLQSPFADPRIRPLVCADETSRVVGFLGLAARPVSLNGKAVLAAISSQFVVDPRSRGPADMELLRAAFAGPQDLILADESNSRSRLLWEALGGSTSLIYSTRWILPLRPCRFGLWAAGKCHKMAGVLVPLAQPFARALDLLCARSSFYPYRPVASKFAGEELDNQRLYENLSGLQNSHALITNYDRAQFDWLLQRAEMMRRHGTVHRIIVRNDRNEIAGWYVYHANQTGLSEVLQLFAVKRFAGEVFNHLLSHAWQNGVVALGGRSEPAFADAFFEKRCPMLYGPEWVLLHSRNPAILRAFETSNVSLSRLDGEWALHFR